MTIVHSFLLVDLAVGCVAVYVVKSLISRSKLSTPPKPPGPKGLPLIGNALDIPIGEEKQWLHWQKHKQLYGPISSVTAFGQTIVILNDYDVAVEIFEKRSGEFSDRPVFAFGGEMVGWQASLPMSKYGERLKNLRRRFHQFLGAKNALSGFVPTLEVEAKRFLLGTMLDPSSLHDQIRKVAGSIILLLTHGYAIKPEGTDALVDLADETMTEFGIALTPGLWLVDTIPALKYLPDWFPGAGFKRTAKRWRKHGAEFIEKPFAFVKEQMAAGKARPSFVSTQLAEAKTRRDEETIKWAAGAMYGGGADTTVSALYTFYLAMTLHPDKMKRAQEEIDTVLGKDILPCEEDRKSLPYVEAVMLESLRWHLVAPLGLPHAAQEDSEFRGYYIPKGSIIMANNWEFAHDPIRYPDPMSFKPERFLKSEGHEPELDPRKYVFGFGRRICPGKDLADTTLWLEVAMSLAAFDIKKKRDADGKEITPPAEYGGLLICHPNKFECDITPRSDKIAAVVRSVEEEHPYGQNDEKSLEAVSWKESEGLFEPW